MKLHDVFMGVGFLMCVGTVTLHYMEALPEALGWVLIGSMTTLIIVSSVLEYRDWQLASKEGKQ